MGFRSFVCIMLLEPYTKCTLNNVIWLSGLFYPSFSSGVHYALESEFNERGENRRLGADGPAEFEKEPVEVQDVRNTL